ncbi:MAG: GGDEF domain-containing protein, partial [Burkholderiaceae bacterium]
REREASRQALERAHGALAQQHRRLQTVSEELRVTSSTDPLTGAYNRRYFFEAADKMLAAQRRTDGALAVIMIDVDHFKEINDVYGHPAGDRVLQTMTAIARDVLRDTDLFARFGGEEFIVALPNTSVAEAAAVAERLRQRVAAQPCAFQGHSIDVRVSCGVAMHGAENASIEDTIKRADVALYRAKSLGRNRVESA